MLIAVDVRSLMEENPTGVAQYGKNVLKALLALDKKNEYILFASGLSHSGTDWSQGADSFQNVKFVHKKIPNKLLNLSQAVCNAPTIDYLLPARPDLFISLNPYFGSVSSNIPTIEIVHDCTPLIYPEFFTLKMRLSYKRFRMKERIANARAIIVPSMTTAQDLEYFFPGAMKKTHIAAPAVEPGFTELNALGDKIKEKERARVQKKYNLPEKFILFLGTIEPRKNIPTLIQAFNIFCSREPKAPHLVIAGQSGWKTKETFNAIRCSPFQDKIRVMGYVRKEDKPALYSSASLFIFPSFYEGFGLPVLEALSVGTPAMCSHTSSMIEYFRGHALLIDPYRPLEMAHAMEEYITDAEAIHPKAKRTAFVQSFSWAKAAQNLYAHIN